MRIRELRSVIDQKKGQRAQIQGALTGARASLRGHKRLQEHLDQAQALLQTVARQTQQELEFQISGLVTMALAAIFPDPYEFQIEFVERRGKTECDCWFIRNGSKIRPIDASGGGVVDVAAFALRVALWRISRPTTRPVLVLDEPFRFVSAGLAPKTSALLKEVSNRLDLQVIMVTHSEDLIDSADRVFKVTQTAGVSQVETV